jgi:CHAT domain-containing protein
VTSDLMTAYYRRLLAGAGRAEALRQASLMVRKKHPEPVDWAPFLAIGQVGPVQGIR